MSRRIIHLALFPEDALDQAAEALETLRGMGITDRDMTVISGTPFSEKMLGRPMSWTRIPIIGISGALVGFLTALFFNFGTPLLYPIRVGGMAYQTLPTSFVVFFELTMLGLLISTFLGVFVEMISPSFGPQGYDPRITDGHIGVLFWAPPELDPRLHESLTGLGAEIIHGAEAKKVMAVLKRLIIVLGLAVTPLLIGLLFTYDILKIEWISFMEIQPSFIAQEDPLPLPARSVPVQGAAYIPELGAPPNPVPADDASVQRGKTQYEINCVICHGATGKGNGPFAAFLVEKKPPSLLEGRPLTLSDGEIFMTITNGVGKMPSLKENLPTPEMRWDVVNYVRSLQKGP